MNAVACQLDIVWENKAANHAKVRQLLKQAAPSPGSLLVLPEMFASGFSMQAATISDSRSRETQGFLADTAQTLGIYLVGGIVTDGRAGLGRNECACYDPQGREIARYCKLHPFTLGGEAESYEAGETIATFEWAGFKVAPFICYDLRFPESFRSAVRQGANLFLVIASWPVARIAHWNALLKARAIENQAYVVGVNRCGQDPQFGYSGQSQIVSFTGDVIATAGAEEGSCQAELSLADLNDYRQRLPFLADMRR
jgi:predicted amidohydrolase